MIDRICLQCGKIFKTHACQVKRGGGKFCCISCGIRYRDLHNNPSKRQEVRAKISKNHADMSGANNPMYGKRGVNAPSYIDGRNKFKGHVYRRILLANNIKPVCAFCGKTDGLHVHHKDGNRSHNAVENLVWVCVKCHNTKAHAYLRNESGQFIGSILAEV